MPTPRQEEPPPFVNGIRKVTCGAILTEDFSGSAIDLTQWRIWEQNPEQTTIEQNGGHLVLTASGVVGHNGLYGLVTTPNKHIVFLGRMYIRSWEQRNSNNPSEAPHRLAFHFCGYNGGGQFCDGHQRRGGGRGMPSPDHWVEILMTDRGDSAEFSVGAALAENSEFPSSDSVLLPYPPNDDQGFMVRIIFDAGTNLAVFAVWDGTAWRSISSPTFLPLNVSHVEAKFHRGVGENTPEAVLTFSIAWFEDLRVYPRPESHFVTVELVKQDGTILRESQEWPPMFRAPDESMHELKELKVRLVTTDGHMISESRGEQNEIHSLLLREAPWDIYPVSARIQLILDGEVIADRVIEAHGLTGLYPGDAYEITLDP